MTTDLWAQLKRLLEANEMVPPGNPTPAEIASHADRLLGNGNVSRFVNNYHYPRLFGGRSNMSETQAEDLVAGIERGFTDGSCSRSWSSGAVATIQGRDFASIRSAIDAAQQGDQIVIRPGVHNEPLVIDKPVTLLGGGRRGETILESQERTTVEVAASDVVIRRLALRMDCTATSDDPPAALVFSRGRATVEECDISGGRTGDGFHVKIGTDAIVRRCRITGCGHVGVWVQAGGTGTFEDCEVLDSGQCGVTAQGNPRFVRTTIAKSAGTGIAVTEGAAVFEYCEIRDNQKHGALISALANPKLRHCNVFNNTWIGLLIINTGMGEFEQCDIYRNGIDPKGYSGVQVQGRSSPVFRNTDIRGNNYHGILIFDNSNPLVEDCRLFDNVTSGVCIHEGCDPVVRRCSVYGNGVYGIHGEGGRGLIENCVVEKNTAQNIRIEENANPVLR